MEGSLGVKVDRLWKYRVNASKSGWFFCGMREAGLLS